MCLAGRGFDLAGDRLAVWIVADSESVLIWVSQVELKVLVAVAGVNEKAWPSATAEHLKPGKKPLSHAHVTRFGRVVDVALSRVPL